jgi:hypothetical protein
MANNGLSVDADADEMNAGGAAVGLAYILFHGFIAFLLLVFGIGIFMAAL